MTGKSAFYLPVLLVFIAMEVIFAFSAFGFITIPPISITFLPALVLAGAFVLGPLAGAILGGIFGLASIWKASVSAVAHADQIFSPFISGNPLASLILSLGVRVLFGFVAGCLFFCRKNIQKKYIPIYLIIVTVITNMFHSFMVYFCIQEFFPETGISITYGVSRITSLASFFNYIIYVNDEQIKDMDSNLKEKAVFLPNYPEATIYMPITKNDNKKVRVNYIGSLRDYESLDTLSKIGLEHDDIEVGLYGTGICFDKLNKKYCDTSIKIYGKYNGIKDSGKIYRNTDILYCSYNPEVKNWKNAYPVKLFEAIITHTPIIVSENTEVSNFVKANAIGEPIQYGNKNSIINAINKIKIHYDEYVENIKKIADDYKWEKIVKNLDRIYDIKLFKQY